MVQSALPAQFDVLVVGGGAAGLYTALCLPARFRVGLITKEPLSLSASDWAQGGIAAAIAPEDSPQLHVEDTLRAGAGLCEPEAVRLLVEQAPACIQAMVEMGVGFDRQGSELALTLEAAHSRRRVLHAADTTGRAMVTTLIAQVLQRPNIQVVSGFVLDLWLEQGVCRGVRLLHEANQPRILTVGAGALVLATGGGGQIYAQTTNPALSTGDGVAMAWRAGAEVRDLEFVQFHPTALTVPGAPRFLISEAVRGEGAHLVDQTGRRFAFDYHPAGELAPRDVVSRAIFNHLAQHPDQSHVYLDLRPIPSDRISHRFPNIIQVCQRWGVDLFTTPIPVAPAAHYWMGGITADQSSQTTLSGLYAVGETASTGVHGANRLASNSLLECLVFGAQLGRLEVGEMGEMGEMEQRQLDWAGLDSQQLQQWRQELAHLMWQSAGISREQASLEAAIAQVEGWRQEFVGLSQPLAEGLLKPDRTLILPPEVSLALRQWGELRNLLDVGLLLLKSAAFRTESRGGHYRADYPAPDPSWQAHTVVQDQQWHKSALIGSTFS
ncbi:MAG: L-aspartate oxidase [Elainella sp.]